MQDSQNPSNLQENKNGTQKIQSKKNNINNKDNTYQQDDSYSDNYSQQFSETIQELNNNNHNMEKQLSAQIEDLDYKLGNQDESFNVSLTKNDSQIQDSQNQINTKNLKNNSSHYEQSKNQQQDGQNTVSNNHSHKQPSTKKENQNSNFHNEIGQQMQNIYSKITKLELSKSNSNIQKQEEMNNSIHQQQNIETIHASNSFKSLVQRKKKSEIGGNTDSWNYVEYDKQGNPSITKQSKNEYDEYIKQIKNKKKISKNLAQQDQQNIFSEKSNSPQQQFTQHKNQSIQQQQNDSENIRSTYVYKNLKVIKKKSEIEGSTTNWNYIKYDEQNNPIIFQSCKNQYDEYIENLQKQQNLNKNNSLKESNVLDKKQKKKTIQHKNEDKQTILDDKVKQHFEHDEKKSKHLQKADQTNIDQGFDDGMRTEYENENNNINFNADDKQTEKKMLISDQSFKIELILNHQPTINPDNIRYQENKEKFQVFFKRNSDQIMKQIQNRGTFKDQSNEYVINFSEFHIFFEKMFENDNFKLLEDSTNLKDIMKNKNITMILATIFKEFLTTVRKIDEKIVIDEKNYEIGIEDMIDFFEFWIRIDEQILVKYDINSQISQVQQTKIILSQNSETASQQKENSQVQKSPIQYQRTQQRLQSLLEGNINKLQSIQKESFSKNYIQQNFINQTLQFLKQQYKKFEKKTLEEQQADINLDRINDSDIPLIQQKIMNIFKEYSTSFVFTSRKQTFDEISLQSNNMNINSYFRFVKDYELQTDYISGAQIIEVFKRNCNGKYMNYTQYYISLVKLAEIKESCILAEQKIQILAIAKMLKLTTDNITKEGVTKVKKYDFKSATSSKNLGSQVSPIQKSTNTTPNKPLSPPQENYRGRIDFSEIQKLSYQQVNSLGNLKSSSPQPLRLQQRDPFNKLNNKNILNINPSQGEYQNKKQKNTGDDFNPNIDSDEEKITLSQKLPLIGHINQVNQNTKVTLESSNLKDLTKIRTIKQEKNFPKAQSTSPPHNKYKQELSQNVKQPPFNTYSNRVKIQNVENSGKRDQISPKLRDSRPTQQNQIQNNKKLNQPESAEKGDLPSYSHVRNQLGNKQHLNKQQDVLSEEQAIQDAILKSTKFRNFFKDQTIPFSKNMMKSKETQNDFEQNIQPKDSNDLQQNKKQYLNDISESIPIFSQQLNQQQSLQKKNSINKQLQQPSQNHPNSQINHQQINQQNNDVGNFSFGKNQSPNNLLKSDSQQNEQNIQSPRINKRGSKMTLQQDTNQTNNSVRVIPVKVNQQFNLEKI